VTKLLLATTNAGKLREIELILAGLPYHLVTLADWGRLVPPDETGDTFEENARAKALYYAGTTKQLTVAEDSGLEIDALGGAPGVKSARWGGEEAAYPRKFDLIYEALRTTGRSDRTARFVCAVALAHGNEILFETRGTIEGLIATEPKGAGGFGYDPIFFYPPFGRTLAESSNRKSTVSHRGKAFAALREYLARNAARSRPT
jgi:XTP/dITP diphosphohydrolase